MAMPYFPASYGYPTPFMTSMQPNPFNQQPQSQNGLIVAWVQGEAAMKSFGLGPNQKAFLFNTEENNFGIKTTDANGMPNPLEMFAYYRINNENNHQSPPVQNSPSPSIDTSLFVTKEELDNRILELMIELEGKSENQNGKGDNKHGK